MTDPSSADRGANEPEPATNEAAERAANAANAAADAADRAAYDAFALGVRIMYALYGIDAPASEFERPYEMLRDIAEGRMTLANPAETAAKAPALRDFLYDRANRVIQVDRETAERILKGLAKAF